MMVTVGALLNFAGCGAEDALLKVQIEELVQQHMKGQDELMKLYDITSCLNFVIAAETNGVREGTVDLALKNKKTGKTQTVAYEFTYNVEKETALTGVKDPMAVVRLMNLGN